MDPLHVHLFVNHVPVIGTIVALATILIGVALKQASVRMVGLGVYVVVSLAVVPTFLTGEPAEEQIEHIAGIEHSTIETHEESAETALVVTIVASVLALVSLVMMWKSIKFSTHVFSLFLVVAITSTVFIGMTSYQGGKIRRPDLGVCPPGGDCN